MLSPTQSRLADLARLKKERTSTVSARNVPAKSSARDRMRRMYLQSSSGRGKRPRLPSTLCHTESSIRHEPSGTDFGAKRALAVVWIGRRHHGGNCAFAILLALSFAALLGCGEKL